MRVDGGIKKADGGLSCDASPFFPATHSYLSIFKAEI